MRGMRLVHRGRTREISAGAGASAGSVSVHVDGRPVAIERGPGEISVDGRRFRVVTAREGNRIWVWCEGQVYEFEPERRSRASAGADHHPGAGLEAPMPGRVRRLVATAGAPVARGDVLLVLEAMKMEHAIRAPHDGTLTRFHVAEGDLVEAGMELVELSSSAASSGDSDKG